MQNNSAVIVSVQYDGSHAPARFRRTPYSMALPCFFFGNMVSDERVTPSARKCRKP